MPDSPPSIDPAIVGLLEAELAPELALLGPLSQGDRSLVFLARDVNLDRPVAVKVLSAERAADHAAKSRFLRAARAAASLSHPNVVPLYRFGFLPTGLPYLVMGYVKGPTLEEKLAAEGVPEAAAGFRIVAEVAEAIAAAHSVGFIHRDLRPANILLDAGTGRALVAGFGLAGIAADARPPTTRITMAGEVLGKAPYASPEQLRGERATEAADVYSLGALGFEVLAGLGPTGPREEDGTASTGGGFRSPSFRASHPLAVELLERCIARDPKRRPSAAYVARALRGVAAARSAPAPARVEAARPTSRPRAAGGPAGLVRRVAGRRARAAPDDPGLGGLRRLAAVWFADIVGYVRMSSVDEPAAMRVVALFQRTARRVVEQGRGRIVKFVGDGVLVEFGSTEVALHAAHRFLDEFHRAVRETGMAGEVRIGMHVGDVAEAADGDIYGEGVNLAARLAAAAAAGAVWVSDDVWRQLRRRPDLRFQPIGNRELKGVEEPVAVYESLPPPPSPERAQEPPTGLLFRPSFTVWYLGAAVFGLIVLLVLLFTA